MHLFRHISCRDIQGGCEVVKVRRSALRSKPTAQQLFGPKDQRHWPCDMTPTWSMEHGSLQPLPLVSHGSCCPGGAQGRVDLPPHPDPNCPATLLLCMHHGGETALVSWLWLGALWLWLCRAGVALLHLLISCKQPLRAINNSTG